MADQNDKVTFSAYRCELPWGKVKRSKEQGRHGEARVPANVGRRRRRMHTKAVFKRMGISSSMPKMKRQRLQDINAGHGRSNAVSMYPRTVEPGGKTCVKVTGLIKEMFGSSTR